MRTQGSLRLILNTKLWAQMQVDKASEKSVRITAMDTEDQGVKVFLISVCWACVCVPLSVCQLLFQEKQVMFLFRFIGSYIHVFAWLLGLRKHVRMKLWKILTLQNVSWIFNPHCLCCFVECRIQYSLTRLSAICLSTKECSKSFLVCVLEFPIREKATCFRNDQTFPKLEDRNWKYQCNSCSIGLNLYIRVYRESISLF